MGSSKSKPDHVRPESQHNHAAAALPQKHVFQDDASATAPNEKHVSAGRFVETSHCREHLCFLSAHEKMKMGEISWKVYLHQAFLHWTGSSHAFDSRPWNHSQELWDRDLVGYGIWKWQQEAVGIGNRETQFAYPFAAKWQVTPNIDDLEAVLRAYATGSPEEVKAKLSALTDHTSLLLQRILCLLALRERKWNILELCLRSVPNGPWDASQANHPLRAMADSINEEAEPEVYAILEKAGWARCMGQKDRYHVMHAVDHLW